MKMFVQHLRPYRPVELSQQSHVILGGGVAGCLFTFVGASHSHVCDSTAFLFLYQLAFGRVMSKGDTFLSLTVAGYPLFWKVTESHGKFKNYKGKREVREFPLRLGKILDT